MKIRQESRNGIIKSRRFGAGSSVKGSDEAAEGDGEADRVREEQCISREKR